MDSLTVSPESKSVSPELALVDPGLAEWARGRLPAPPDTLEALADAHTSAISEPATGARRARRWRSRLMTWAAMLVVLAGTAFLVGSGADSETPTAAPLTAVVELQPPTMSTEVSGRLTQPAPRPRAPRRSAVAAAAARRFAWPPVVGATGYRVELFKGSALIFRENTKKPQILIRRAWRFNGRRHTLRPGAYRWYVWPLVGGQLKAKAIVQAKLVVPR